MLQRVYSNRPIRIPFITEIYDRCSIVLLYVVTGGVENLHHDDIQTNNWACLLGRASDSEKTLRKQTSLEQDAIVHGTLSLLNEKKCFFEFFFKYFRTPIQLLLIQYLSIGLSLTLESLPLRRFVHVLENFVCWISTLTKHRRIRENTFKINQFQKTNLNFFLSW